MKHNVSKKQDGYALLLMVIALMGVGGLVMSGYTQDVKQQAELKRYQHNQRVLREAKLALLQWAYNYPQMGPGQDDGPGRLPCPDTDIPGSPNSGLPNSNSNCIDSGIEMVGRFPWRDPDMHFYEAMDASGEHLWYAVSSNFAYGAGTPVLNSDTTGTITIEDRSGAVLHDGATNNGVAAVIIAPGAALARAGVNQDRAAGPTVATNYLDLFGTVDNADFVNNDGNGFVKGPIFNPVDSSLLVNDQMIVITADEVSAMAEKATLQAYRRAIINYLDTAGTCTGAGTDRNTCETGGGTWTPVYPWLFNYQGVNTVAELSNKFELDPDFGSPPNYHDNYGRIPALFGNYFAANNSEPIESTLDATLTIDYSGRIVGRTPTLGPGTDLNFAAAQPRNQTLALPIPGILDLQFNISGRLSTNLAAQQILGRPLYFRDLPGVAATGFWTICPDTNGNGNSEEVDCDSGIEQQVLRLQFQVNVPVNVGFEIDYSTPAVIAVDAATPVQHAYITGTIPGSSMSAGVDLPVISASYLIDRNLDFGLGEVFQIQESGDLTMADLLSGNFELALRMIYYPELPTWAFDNGWHNSIRMAYADDHQPGIPGDCDLFSDDCLKLPDSAGAPRDKVSVLVIAGEHDWSPDPPAGLSDDLLDVFDTGNEDANGDFFAHIDNDKLLVIEEL